MIVTFALLITFSSGMTSQTYYENQNACLKSLTWHVVHNPARIVSIECTQLKEPAKL